MSSIKKPDYSSLRADLLSYTNWMILPKKELLSLSSQEKLILCQITDPKALKKWPHGQYVPIGYIERCLNFVSLFDWWGTVLREGYEKREIMKRVLDEKTKVQKKDEKWELLREKKIIHDAWVLCHFYINLNGVRVERSCFGARQMYDNPAISSFSVIEAARSMATKSFADTLGIASDKLSKEFDEMRKQKEIENIWVWEVIDWFEKTT